MKLRDLSVRDLVDTLQSLKTKDLTENLPSGEDIAQALGLTTRSRGSDVFSGLGLFAAGILVGAGLALLFAPTSGDELREDLGERVSSLREGFSQSRDDAGTGSRPARTA